MQLGIPYLTGPAAPTQHGANRQAITDTRTDLMAATWRTAGTIAFTYAIQGSGYRQTQTQLACGKPVEQLIGNGYMQQIEIGHGS